MSRDRTILWRVEFQLHLGALLALNGCVRRLHSFPRRLLNSGTRR